MSRVHVAPSATANGELEVYGAPPLSVVPSEQARPAFFFLAAAVLPGFLSGSKQEFSWCNKHIVWAMSSLLECGSDWLTD